MPLSLVLPIFKQGDDVEAIKAQNPAKNAEAVLRAYAELLTATAIRVKKVADIIHDTPTTVVGNTHAILLDDVPEATTQLLRDHLLIEDDQ